MERFVIIVNGWKPLTITTKHSILDIAAALDPSLRIIYILYLSFGIWFKQLLLQWVEKKFMSPLNIFTQKWLTINVIVSIVFNVTFEWNIDYCPILYRLNILQQSCNINRQKGVIHLTTCTYCWNTVYDFCEQPFIQECYHSKLRCVVTNVVPVLFSFYEFFQQI